MEQDGVRTDERSAPTGGRLAALLPTGPRSRIVVRTLLVADTGLLLVTGALLALFMQAPAGLMFGGACWALAALLLSVMHAAGRALTRRERWAIGAAAPPGDWTVRAASSSRRNR